MTKNKKIIFCFATVFLLITVAILAAVISYPNALVSFSGIELTDNGGTTQGFIDITVKNVNSPGISFCLKYDPSIIKMSDVDTNAVLSNPSSTSFDLQHKYFEQDTDNFPDGSFKDRTGSIFPAYFKNYPIIGIADLENGHIIMNFNPDDAANVQTPNLDYIEADDRERLNIMASEPKDGLRLGRISFQVVDYEKFSTKKREEIIDIVPFSEMDVTLSGDDGVYISYLDDKGDIQWYDQKDKNTKWDIDITAALSEVSLLTDNLTVSAYDIYKTGTIQDLVDFLNERMCDIKLKTADNLEKPDKFTWTEPVGITWNPKGGEYTIIQKYNDDFSLTATVTVTPVTLTGFEFDNENLTYWTGSENYPTTFEDLNLADKSRPIFDTYIPNGGVPMLDTWYSTEANDQQITTLPQEIVDKTPGEYKFLGHIQTTELDKYPWLTRGNPVPEILAIRNVVANEEDLPQSLEVIKSKTSDNGTLTIEVRNKNTASPIPPGTEFVVKLPDGEKIDWNVLGADHYTINIDNGVATITISPDMAIDDHKKIAQAINLGKRGGAFSIASIEPTKTQGEYTDFEPNARKNIYTGSSYEFDYSGGSSAMFPVKAGSDLPTTVTLPYPEHGVDTTYDGYDGKEPGFLRTFTVDEWIPQTGSGNKDTVGDVIILKGVLLETQYTNYGLVENPNNVEVTIKYLVQENDGEDSIEKIQDFEYDRQQVGYDYDLLQTHSFKIKNTGSKNLYGLSAVISVAADNNMEAFNKTSQLPVYLAPGETADLDIQTKFGLPIGDYVSTVSIYSNNKLLDTFTITFRVIEEKVYKITLNPNKTEWGSAKTKNGQNTATAGETVTIVAEPKADCKFVEWKYTGTDGAVVFADSSVKETTFVMPAQDVTIEAVFEETDEAKLRVTDLYVKDVTENNQTLLDKDWKAVTYDPLTNEYFVVVENDIDEVTIWFKVRDEASDATKTLTVTVDPSPAASVNTPYDSNDKFYKSDLISLEEKKDHVADLTVTSSSDSSVKKAYKIHIRRKTAKSNLITFNYGNSPYGLIMRDTNIPDADKDTKKQSFIDDGYMFTSGNAPNGAIAGVVYRPEAWSGVNYDLNDIALFVTDKTSFIDSGCKTIENSIGAAVNESDVSKKVKVNTLKFEDTAKQNGSPDDFNFIGSDMETITLASTGPITELSGKRIRPDSYELEYSFTDFDGSTVTLTRPIIILSPLGDVNISNAADNTDVDRILHRNRVHLSDQYNVLDYNRGGRLNKFRIGDVNKDGSVNAVDANYIRKGNIVSFYTNLTSGGGGTG